MKQTEEKPLNFCFYCHLLIFPMSLRNPQRSFGHPYNAPFWQQLMVCPFLPRLSIVNQLGPVPVWEAKILLGVLRQQGLAGKGLVKAFEKWAPRVVGRSRAEMNRVYREQTGREMSDYILVQQADKVVRYNQLPPEAEVVRSALLSANLSRAKGDIQPEQAENPAEKKGGLQVVEAASA